jgi:hypothetical protein
MTNLKQFESDFKKYLEFTFGNSKEDDIIKKLAETESKVLKYIDQYLQNSDSPIKNINQSAQYILDEFSKEKIKFI